MLTIRQKSCRKNTKKYNLVESYFEYFCPFYYLDLHSLSLIVEKFSLWWSFPISFLTEKYFDFPLTIFNDFGTLTKKLGMGWYSKRTTHQLYFSSRGHPLKKFIVGCDLWTTVSPFFHRERQDWNIQQPCKKSTYTPVFFPGEFHLHKSDM